MPAVKAKIVQILYSSAPVIIGLEKEIEIFQLELNAVNITIQL